MAHVTFFMARALPGHRDAIIEHMRRWEREQAPKQRGWERSVLIGSNSDPDQIAGLIRWDNTENYKANANRPEQDAWYRELRSHLAGDPQWFDGTLAYDTAAAGVTR